MNFLNCWPNVLASAADIMVQGGVMVIKSHTTKYDQTLFKVVNFIASI